MNDFDKMMRELSGKVDVPDNYNSRIDDVLRSLPDKEQKESNGGNRRVNRIIGVVMCIFALVFALEISSLHANANIFDSFKMTIMDIFHIGKDNTSLNDSVYSDVDEYSDGSGIASKTENAKGKRDLMIELRETIVDPHGLYALVKITAPSDIEFNDNISFDYFAFCEGENYNSEQTIGGVTNCYMLERRISRPNEALFVVDLTGDVGAYEGKKVAVCLKDLTANPYGDTSEVLVSGMWSVSFQADSTVRDNIDIDCSISDIEDVTFPYINTTAYVVSIEMSPLGLSIISDVSNMPFEDLGVSDTTIGLRLKMKDGREYILSPYSEDENYITDNSESEFNEENGISYQKDIYSFKKPVDINNIAGFYVQDIFIPAH